MSSNFHYPIDLNEDQNHQPFFCAWGSHQASSSSSSTSSLSYLPLFNSPQEHGGHNTYHADHPHSQSLEAKMFVSNGGSCDHTIPKKEPRLKLTIRKKKQDRSDRNDRTKGEGSSSPTTTVKWMPSKMRLMKKMIMTKTPANDPPDPTNFEEDIDRRHMSPMSLPDHGSDDHTSTNEDGYGNNNGVIRVCSDCNTTKTPLWRSGPRGPKSLCNACGIRQRKARRAAMAAAAAAAGGDDAPVVPPPKQLTVKKKMQNKNKRSSHSNGGDHQAAPKTKKCKIMANSPEIQSKPSSSSSNKLCFDDLTIILSKSSAYQQVFPQDEKEAAILLMALSYGMVHG